MKRTKKKPTKPGWYRYYPGDEWPEKRMIYYVDEDLDVWINHQEPEFYPISEFDGSWEGPLLEDD